MQLFPAVPLLLCLWDRPPGLSHAALVRPILAAAGFQPAQSAQGTEYFGKLEPALAPNRDALGQYELLPIAAGVFVAKLRITRQTPEITIARTESSDGTQSLSVDSKPIALVPNPRGDFSDAVVRLPLSFGMFQDFPVVVGLYHPGKGPRSTTSRFLLFSDTARARGTVDLDGHRTLVEYEFDPREEAINLTNLRLGVDTDGDGAIEAGEDSPEVAYGEVSEPVVFRAGNHYVSTKSVSLTTGRIVMRSHEASEYKRIEWRPGAPVPDFSFTDLTGRKRALSGFRGKFLLLDFWYAACAPCLAEIPVLKRAYERFHSRGFDIVGLNSIDADGGKLSAFCAEHGVTWPQAEPSSIGEVVRTRFRIRAWPLLVLLDPNGKIVSRDISPEKLEAEIERLLAKESER